MERKVENRMANWVSAGYGVIVNELAQAMEKKGRKALYGVVNRTQEKLLQEAFCGKNRVYRRCLQALKRYVWILVDIVYIQPSYYAYSIFTKSTGSRQACTVENPLR